ncbi:hypothetical protein QL285_078703 [Trifolium repens]|nr:hypothetical protein QL285_078703 [Trifolium repens]
MKVNGNVNPNKLLSVLAKSGKHAEIKYVKLNGEVVERNSNYYDEYGYNAYDNMQYCPYPPPLPCHQRYHNPYQPPPPPASPGASKPYQFPPPPSPGPVWEPPQSQPPQPPSMSGNKLSPSRSVCSHQNLPGEETLSRQNKPNKCSMM